MAPSGFGDEPVFPSTSKYAWLLDQVQEDGTVSFDVAKQAFSIAVAPLPGVADPVGDPPAQYERVDGTSAILWLTPYVDQLTAEQRVVWDQETTPPSDAVPIRDQGQAGRRLMGGFAPAVAADVTMQTFTDALADARVILNKKLGRTLSFDPVFTRNLNHEGGGGVLAMAIPLGRDGRMQGCWIRANPELSLMSLEALRASMAHEMYHCYQMLLWDHNGLPLVAHPAWLLEGSAEWVGETAMGPSEIGRDWWAGYLVSPTASTFDRSYDAVGFYEHMVEEGTDPWTKLDDMMLAGTSAVAYDKGRATDDAFLDTWASGFFRDSLMGAPWNAVGIWQVQQRAGRQKFNLGNGDIEAVSADYVANTIIDLNSTADIVETSIGGHARLRAGTIDDIGLQQRFYCTRSGGCTCPAGQTLSLSDLENAPPQMSIGITGGLETVSGTVVGHRLEEYCTPGTPRPPSTGPPCSTGCGGSNGDPHMKTVDGSRYDLQAAGEYVLLRSPDSSVEMQARQEPRGEVATINTAVATKVNDHRVGFYMSETGSPEVKIDGQPVAADAVGSTDLGTGATLSSYQRGYELDFPDGTKLWALSMGSWGINVLVLPSDALRADGVGIIARVPSDARFRIPALPDGSTLPAPANHDEHYQELYGTFAPAWRVTRGRHAVRLRRGTDDRLIHRRRLPTADGTGRRVGGPSGRTGDCPPGLPRGDGHRSRRAVRIRRRRHRR